MLLGSRLEVEHECCIAGASQLGDLVPSLDVRRATYLRIRRIVTRRCISRWVLPWVVVLRWRSVVLSLGWRRRRVLALIIVVGHCERKSGRSADETVVYLCLLQTATLNSFRKDEHVPCAYKGSAIIM